MRKHYYHATIFRYIAACFLCLVMLSATASGFFADTGKQRTEWKKMATAPEMVPCVYEVPVQRAVVYEVNPKIDARGVTPAVIAKCRSPGV